MNILITPLERLILISIKNKHYTINEIESDTGVNKETINGLISSLLVKNFITLEDNHYLISKEVPEILKEELQNKKLLINELKFLTNLIIERSINDELKSFKFKRVKLTESQKKLLNAMFYNIESFLIDCDHENKNLKTKDETIIFWGQNSNIDITKQIMERI